VTIISVPPYLRLSLTGRSLVGAPDHVFLFACGLLDAFMARVVGTDIGEQQAGVRRPPGS
jgi:hypothetical protein